MIKDDRKDRKIFINETLGHRKYFSYRSDMIFLKILLCGAVFFVIYAVALDNVLAALVTIQTFLIFTLVNRMNIERREKEGKKLYIEKARKEYFSLKINELKADRFEDLIKLLAMKEGYKNYRKAGRHMFSAIKGDETHLVKVFKLYDLSEVEKLDIREVPSFMHQNGIKKCYIVTLNKLTGEAEKYIEKLNGSLDVRIIDDDILFKLAEKHGMLPDDSFFLKKVNDRVKSGDKKAAVKNNVISSKKIVVYSLAAVIFNLMSGFLPENGAAKYISYYFIILAFISAVYIIYSKIFEGEGKTVE